MILLDLSFALSFSDLLVTPLVIIGVYIFAINYQKKQLLKNDAYNYFLLGISAKIFGAMALGMVYNFYYKGGDTLNYYQTALTFSNLFYQNPLDYSNVLFGDNSNEQLSAFNYATGWPFFWDDNYTFFVSRVVSVFVIICGGSYIASSILLAVVAFSGMWKLYLIFCEQFPTIKKKLAIAILFMPSVVFWGSGILKDTITISAVGWYSYAVYCLIVRKEKYSWPIFQICLSSFFILSIKPYILFAIFPGTLIWLSSQKLARMKNKVFKFIAAPFLLISAGFIAIYSLEKFGDLLGVYSIDSISERASLVNQDLKRDFYNGNSFDIGDYDGTFSGMLLKAPLGVEAALFRPYLWEVKNPVMLISAIENAYLFLLTVFLLIRLKFFKFFKHILSHPLLLFSFLFSMFFAFSVGISISNFGALVRLKIPCIPFFVASVFILKNYYDVGKIRNK
jgi:hypothetical protein